MNIFTPNLRKLEIKLKVIMQFFPADMGNLEDEQYCKPRGGGGKEVVIAQRRFRQFGIDQK